MGVSLSEQGLTVAGEAPFHLLIWLSAIESAYRQVETEVKRDGPRPNR